MAEVNLDLLANPIIYEQAIHHLGWQAAMDDEIQSIMKNQTWTLIQLPPYKKAITSKWIILQNQAQYKW